MPHCLPYGPIRSVRKMISCGVAVLLAAGCTTVTPEEPVPAIISPSAPPGGMQWLYGSGEGAVTSIQTYNAFSAFVLRAIRNRPVHSVVLAEGATLAAPHFVPCADKPFAVVLDVDETAIQNLGYEYDEAVKGRTFDPEIWERWERTGADRVQAMPGAVQTLQTLRSNGVKVIFNSNRKAQNVAQTVVALEGVGLGPAEHGHTLFLAGDDSSGSAKDMRRSRIATTHCVVAMAGDQLGDFSDMFNDKGLSVVERRNLAASNPFANKWGTGWFMFSNPVYGPSIRGTFDDVFPVQKRWIDPGADAQ